MAHAAIDSERCQGHGRCALIAPNVFDLDDSGAGKVIADPVSESDLDEVREAVISCPENAITLSE